MATIIVTGAAGFIGSHTCDQLLAEGHSVLGIDNFRTGKPKNLAGAREYAAFTFVEADVTDESVMDDVVAKSRPAAIIHLAALVSVQESVMDPGENFRCNILGTHMIAEAARRHRVPRVVFASSAAVYGDAGTIPITENVAPNPITPYGAAKLASEALIWGHAAAFAFTAWCHRYFNVYGPRQDPRSPYSGVISIFCERMRTGTAPVIFGDGRQTRDFVSVHDVARANVIAATRAGIASGMANICTGRAVSLNDLVEHLRSLYLDAVVPIHAPAKAGDIRHSVGSPARARQMLEFSATVSLAAGLAELLDNSSVRMPAHI